jgi:Family of unknown function (DUF6174)
MKTWVQLIGVFMLCCQMAACGGGDSKAAATAEMPVQEPVSNTALLTPAQLKALTDAFNEAQTLWTNTAPANYHYSYKSGGAGYKFDTYSPIEIWVRNGQISQVISGVQVLDAQDYVYASIEQIFANLAYSMSQSQPDTQFNVEYDPLLGFPTVIKSTTRSCCDQAWQLIVTDLHIDP